MQLSSGKSYFIKANRIDASADLNYKLGKFIEANICCFTTSEPLLFVNCSVGKFDLTIKECKEKHWKI